MKVLASFGLLVLRTSLRSNSCFSRFCHNNMNVPVAPSYRGTSIASSLLAQVEQWKLEQSAEELSKDRAIKEASSLLDASNSAIFAIRLGNFSQFEQLSQNRFESLESNCCREGVQSLAVETFTLARILHAFYTRGVVICQSSCPICSDDEYVGALLGFAQEISRYSIGRACEDDIQSILICRQVLIDLNQKFLEFNFRNGPLRRKFDGLKYALRNVENILYEYSLTTPAGVVVQCDPNRGGVDGDTIEGSAAFKRPRQSDCDETDSHQATAAALIELEQLRLRLDAFDALREEVIKLSRDVQKFSKQAIFAVHRQNFAESSSKLRSAESTLSKIMSAVEKNPALRGGSVTGCLEEWAEGRLTLEWAESKRVLAKSDLPYLDLADYLSALSDFTGEIGRIAVNLATRRELEAIKEIHQVDLAVSWAMVQLCGNRYHKKYEAVQTNLKKVEDVIYEVTMLRRGGKVGTTSEPMPVIKDDSEDASDGLLS